MNPRRRRLPVLVGVTAVLVLPGCSGTTVSPGDGMATGRGYHYSTLTCAAPTALPGSRVRVVLADRGMTRMMGGVAPMGSPMRLQAFPSMAAEGEVSLVVTNLGWRTHELVVLPLRTDASIGHRAVGADGKVSETGSLGEASRSCGAGAGEGIRARTTGWVTLTLRPGRYELLCDLRNHYADGMYAELDVT